VSEVLKEHVEEEPEIKVEPETKDCQPDFENQFTIRRDDSGTYIIEGEGIQKLVAMTRFGDAEGLRRFQLIYKKMGIEDALREKGVQEGDTVKISSMEFEFKE
jgi:GTP-binding protein